MMNNNYGIPNLHYQLITDLLKPGAELLDSVTESKMNMMHAIIGMAGELGELNETILRWAQSNAMTTKDRENICEELGDFLFYEGALRIHAEVDNVGVAVPKPAWFRGITPVALKSTSNGAVVMLELLNTLNIHSSRAIDVVKKYTMYEHDLEVADLRQHLADANWAVTQMAVIMNFSEAEIRLHNIEKLRERYADGYSDKAAKERVDKQKDEEAD